MEETAPVCSRTSTPLCTCQLWRWLIWVIKLQMARSHCTVLGNAHTEHWTRRAGSPGPLLQQPKAEWGNGNCAVLWIFLPMGKLPGWNSRCSEPDCQETLKPSVPLELSKNRARNCSHKSDPQLPPQPGPCHALPRVQGPSQSLTHGSPSFRAHSLLPFPFIDTGKKMLTSP